MIASAGHLASPRSKRNFEAKIWVKRSAIAVPAMISSLPLEMMYCYTFTPRSAP